MEERMKGTSRGGEIVQVKGGHILRSTSRKDRHSKVYTSKGPRERRVRLSAHTAIQFYDVQDRLGYDRPSKAVDWLIRKAKIAIDKLGLLPPWQPVNDTNLEADTARNGNGNPNPGLDPQSGNPFGIGLIQGSSNTNDNPGSSNSSFLVPPGDQSDDIQMVNTMQPFFSTSSLNSFPGFTIDAIPRNGFQGEELCLTLHTENGNSGNMFQECYQRINSWNSGCVDTGRVGFGENTPQAMFSQGLGFSPRELLQSNLGNQSWNQRPLASMNQQNPQPCQSSDFGNPFDFGGGIPSRIYGEEKPDSPV